MQLHRVASRTHYSAVDPMRRVTSLVILLGMVVAVSAAAGKAHSTFPKCRAFATSKVDRLVAIGKLYLDHTLAGGRSCTYYGVDAAKATKLATTGVLYSKIKYYPSLMIAVTPATKSLFDIELGLEKRTASKQGLEFDAVHKKLRFTREEYFYAGKISGHDETKCDPQIEYDNWAGPPECDGEPALKKVGVIAFMPTSGGRGRLLTITATQQAPPGSVSISHILKLARETVDGQLY
jgi:hypothetical protein